MTERFLRNDQTPPLIGEPGELTQPPRPTTLLLPPESAPWEMLKRVKVKDGRMTVGIPGGTVGVDFVVFPTPDIDPVFLAIERGQDGKRTPFVVMQKGIHFGLAITAPRSLVQKNWSAPKKGVWMSYGAKLFDTATPIPVTFREKGIDYMVEEVYQEREALALAVRIGGDPLFQRKEKKAEGEGAYREILFDGNWQPYLKDTFFSPIRRKVTEMIEDYSLIDTKEEKDSKETIEDLIFRPSDENKEVEIVVYKGRERKITAIVNTPIQKRYNGGFENGSLRFGMPRREKILINSIENQKPLVAFKLVLVGEDLQKGQIMKAT